MEDTQKQTVEPKRLKNDIPEDLKARIRDEVTKRIESLLQQEDFSTNDMSQLTGIAHGSVRARTKTMSSAAEIITAVFNGTRKSPSGKPTVQSVKALVESMTPEERTRFLAEIGLN